MLIFSDFETEGLNGPIIELSLLDKKGNIILKQSGQINLQKVYETILNVSNNDYTIIFWHQFMPIYLAKYQEEFFNNIEGKFICFTDIYSFCDGVKRNRYSISKITKNLINKEHKGNSLSDTKDLLKCFKKLNKKCEVNLSMEFRDEQLEKEIKDLNDNFECLKKKIIKKRDSYKTSSEERKYYKKLIKDLESKRSD